MFVILSSLLDPDRRICDSGKELLSVLDIILIVLQNNRNYVTFFLQGLKSQRF